MPIYVYECCDCESLFKVRHRMSEVCECCTLCGASNVVRKPTSFTNLSKTRVQKSAIGDLTKEFIDNAKFDLKEQQKELEDKR